MGICGVGGHYSPYDRMAHRESRGTRDSKCHSRLTEQQIQRLGDFGECLRLVLRNYSSSVSLGSVI